MSSYHRSQLTSSNGHVTGIDSPIPTCNVVVPVDTNPYLKRLVEGGLEAIEKEVERLQKNRKQASCLAEFDGIDMALSACAKARKIIADAQSQQ
jgi:prefoldin subunit 5